MKVLFVSSGNSKHFEISPFIKVQGESLRRLGIDIEYFRIVGKGFKGYLNNVKPLKRHIKRNKYDIIHAHYSLCGLVTTIAARNVPIIVSFMGNDAFGDYDESGRFKFSSLPNVLLAIIMQPFLSYVISKSHNTGKRVYFARHQTVPNGVDILMFKPIGINMGSKGKTKNILFLGNPEDLNKNYSLLVNSVKFIDYDVEIIAPYPVQQSALPELYNKADVFVLCSIVEGSPNVIKEAMACNCPIVSTDVGDVKWLLGDVEGHYIADNSPKDFAEKIELALEYGKRTKGRERLIELELDSESVGKKIIEIYKSVLK